MGWFRHIFSLPCISNRHDEPEDITFLSTFATIDDFFESTSDIADPIQTNNLENVNEQLQENMSTSNESNVDLKTVPNHNKIVVCNEDDGHELVSQIEIIRKNNESCHIKY
jgi:2,3-bisphosphoglycerate-independent phosphoglycerate mutase